MNFEQNKLSVKFEVINLLVINLINNSLPYHKLYLLGRQLIFLICYQKKKLCSFNHTWFLKFLYTLKSRGSAHLFRNDFNIQFYYGIRLWDWNPWKKVLEYKLKFVVAYKVNEYCIHYYWMFYFKVLLWQKFFKDNT